MSQPEFSYSLSVQGGDITFLPGLEVFINSFVRDAVLRPYVLPEGFRVPLDSSMGQMEVGLPSCGVAAALQKIPSSSRRLLHRMSGRKKSGGMHTLGGDAG